MVPPSSWERWRLPLNIFLGGGSKPVEPMLRVATPLKMAASSEPVHKLAASPQLALKRAGLKSKCLVSSLADTPVISVWVSGVPKVPNPVVPDPVSEVLPLESALTVAAALLCVWAVCCSSTPEAVSKPTEFPSSSKMATAGLPALPVPPCRPALPWTPPPALPLAPPWIPPTAQP